MSRSKRLFLLAVFLLVFHSGEARAHDVPTNMYRGIMAEAVGEGDRGMYAVACVYRNRLNAGIPLGCVGLKRKDLIRFCNRESAGANNAANRIVSQVFVKHEPDITGGATHYENIEAFGMPRWAKNMKVTAKIGRHTFFKAIR